MSRNTTKEQSDAQKFLTLHRQAMNGPLDDGLKKYKDRHVVAAKLLDMSGAELSFVELGTDQLHDRKVNPGGRLLNRFAVDIVIPDDNFGFNRPDGYARLGVVSASAIGRFAVRPPSDEHAGSWYRRLEGDEQSQVIDYLRSPHLDDGTLLGQVMDVDPDRDTKLRTWDGNLFGEENWGLPQEP